MAADGSSSDVVKDLFGRADADRDGGLNRMEAEVFLELLESASGVPLLAHAKSVQLAEEGGHVEDEAEEEEADEYEEDVAEEGEAEPEEYEA
mmetsp:Transcript_17525/g.40470  ORF Transcript_17525/g.40470 Transcript_17525/m.40470 type:complete len:92 (-) Transcript_17525:216-491(-)